MVDCIVAYAASVLVDKMTDPRSQEGREMLEAVKADARASKQFLLLAHLWDSDLYTWRDEADVRMKKSGV